MALDLPTILDDAGCDAASKAVAHGCGLDVLLRWAARHAGEGCVECDVTVGIVEAWLKGEASK